MFGQAELSVVLMVEPAAVSQVGSAAERCFGVLAAQIAASQVESAAGSAVFVSAW